MKKHLIYEILSKWDGLIFTDVSGAKYKIIDKTARGANFIIKVIKEGAGDHKIINGPMKPYLKSEWNYYCVKIDGNTYKLSKQYLTNITYRGYIEVLKFGKHQQN